MVEPDSSSSRHSWKESLLAAAQEILVRLYKKIPEPVLKKAQEAVLKLDRLEAIFKKQNIIVKIGLIFFVAGAATFLPGGYTALGLWTAQKMARHRQKKSGLDTPAVK